MAKYTITLSGNGESGQWEESSRIRAERFARRLRHEVGNTSSHILVSVGCWDDEQVDLLLYVRDTNGDGQRWYKAAL